MSQHDSTHDGEPLPTTDTENGEVISPEGWEVVDSDGYGPALHRNRIMVIYGKDLNGGPNDLLTVLNVDGDTDHIIEVQGEIDREKAVEAIQELDTSDTEQMVETLTGLESVSETSHPPA